ncbi:MAG: HNH/ENDO VII family nuclease [Tannerella sp.]|jgi:hypothetical protein|nr:HNH/ENDO VII family nuclease [Tannerella sp.]
MEIKKLTKAKETGETGISEIRELKRFSNPEFPETDYKNIVKEQLDLIKSRPLESLREQNNQLIKDVEEKRPRLTEDEKKKIKEAHPDWPDEIIDAISSWKEYEVYNKAGLIYAKINWRHCLIRPDLDLDYVDHKTGKTNRELMAEGKAPVDPKTGEKIELHHIGQKFDGPLAELTESEHSDNFGILHTSNENSWRREPEQNDAYNNHQRPEHWKSRSNG